MTPPPDSHEASGADARDSRDMDPAGESILRHWRGATPYAIAALPYIGLGLWDQRFLLSWAEGITFCFLAVWAVPALWRRVRP